MRLSYQSLNLFPLLLNLYGTSLHVFRVSHGQAPDRLIRARVCPCKLHDIVCCQLLLLDHSQADVVGCNIAKGLLCDCVRQAEIQGIPELQLIFKLTCHLIGVKH